VREPIARGSAAAVRRGVPVLRRDAWFDPPLRAPNSQPWALKPAPKLVSHQSPFSSGDPSRKARSKANSTEGCSCCRTRAAPVADGEVVAGAALLNRIEHIASAAVRDDARDRPASGRMRSPVSSCSTAAAASRHGGMQQVAQFSLPHFEPNRSRFAGWCMVLKPLHAGRMDRRAAPDCAAARRQTDTH